MYMFYLVNQKNSQCVRTLMFTSRADVVFLDGFLRDGYILLDKQEWDKLQET